MLREGLSLTRCGPHQSPCQSPGPALSAVGKGRRERERHAHHTHYGCTINHNIYFHTPSQNTETLNPAVLASSVSLVVVLSLGGSALCLCWHSLLVKGFIVQGDTQVEVGRRR